MSLEIESQRKEAHADKDVSGSDVGSSGVGSREPSGEDAERDFDAGSAEHLDDASADERDDELLNYRQISTAALIGALLGPLSLLAFVDPLLSALPLVGLLFSLRGWYIVRSRPTELTGLKMAHVGLVCSAFCLFGSWAWFTYDYMTEVPPGYDRLTFDILQPEEGSTSLIPASALEWNGKRAFVRGYMYPGPKRVGLRNFIIVRDRGTCCFGSTEPKKTDMIQVKLTEPLRADYSFTVFKLAGTFRVAPQKGDGAKVGEVLYQLEADYIK